MNRRQSGALLFVTLTVLSTVALVRSGRLDGQAPRITLVVPVAPVRTDIPITGTVVDAAPGLASVTVLLDDMPPQTVSVNPSGQFELTLQAPQSDGPHTITVEAVDAAWSRNTGHAEATVHTDQSPPQIEWAVVPARPAQGEVAALFLRGSEPLTEPTASGLEQHRPLRPLDNDIWRVLLGVGVQTPSGAQQLQVDVADSLGNAARCFIPIDVEATEFPRGGTIRLSKRQVAARRDAEALAQMKADRSAAYGFDGPTAHWSGAILRPAPGRRSSAFGRYRTYSDGRKRHHLGTDIANLTGTPVQAALAGEVRAAGWQHLFGNAVIVHHGHGLTTSYNHLSQFDVAVGDVIPQGQVIGTIGSTGQSTGPHLHWGMQVGEVEVDPERWPDHGYQLDTVMDSLSWTAAARCETSR